MILYMNSDWQPQFGGELNLLTRREEGSFETERSIAPAPNTMVCLELSKHSWHSVTATDPKYQRKTIIADFDYVKG